MTDSKSRCVVEISTDYRPTIDRLSTDHRPTIDRLSTDCRPTIDRLSTAISTAMSTDISVDITHSKQDPYILHFIFYIRVVSVSDSQFGVPGLSDALVTCWICSQSFRVQILGHACKLANWLPPAIWGF